MKRNSLFLGLLIATACAAFSGCRKEPEAQAEFLGMRLVAEGFGGAAKAAVSGNNSYWIDGETVRINGTDYPVTVPDGGTAAYVRNVEEAATYRALYPNTLNSSAALDDNNVTVTLPATYTYRRSGSLQALDVPMAALGASGERLYFQHLTAALTVEVVNDFGIDLAVDSIVVTSNSYQISGSKSVTLAETITVEPNGSPASAADKRVTVRFDGGTLLTVASGTTERVQVPVLPVGGGNKFTIKVVTHNVDDAVMTYTFERTQATGGALSRKQMAYAKTKFGGVFSVGGGNQVRFAPGNLQYYCSSSAPQWRFAQHQYDNATFNINNYAENSRAWIDLFGFASSGYSGHNPWEKGTNHSFYYPGSEYHSISGTNYDWGYNTISNGGNTAGVWRTLTASEWDYLVHSRSGKIAKAKCISDSHKGMIILPDDWELPSDCDFNASTINNYTAAQWKKMEVAGAIFLPANGYRDASSQSNTSYGFYWSDAVYSHTSSQTKVKCMMFNHTSGATFGDDVIYDAYLGMSVRLVRDVE